MTTAEPELFGAVTLPASITVPSEGVAEPWLLKQLGLSTAQVHPLHGEEVGAPRDYGYRGNCYQYTASGVRRLVEHFHLPVDVIDCSERIRPPTGTCRRLKYSKRWDLEDRP